MSVNFCLEEDTTASVVSSGTPSENLTQRPYPDLVEGTIERLTLGVDEAPAYAQHAKTEREYVQCFLTKAALPTKEYVIAEGVQNSIPGMRDHKTNDFLICFLNKKSESVIAGLKAGLNQLRNQKTRFWFKPKPITDGELKKKISAVYKRQCKLQKQGRGDANTSLCKNSANAVLNFLRMKDLRQRCIELLKNEGSEEGWMDVSMDVMNIH